MKPILIKKAIILDPSLKIKNKADLLIKNKRIFKISDSINLKDAKIIKADNLFLIPGIIDSHVHTRTPGDEKAEDFHSINLSALSSGITSIIAMPNTNPAQDNSLLIKKLNTESKKYPLNIFFSGAITLKREGIQNTDFKSLKKANVKVLTDDGSWVKNDLLMDNALKFSLKTKIPIASHCQFPLNDKNAPINEGIISKKLKINGLPEMGEILALLRDLFLNSKHNSFLHIQHLSLKKSIEIIKLAKRNKMRITCETCPHYFYFTEDNLINLNTNFKMYPPLRTKEDKKEIIKAIKDGYIDLICSDHAPHTKEKKSLDIFKAPFGVIGLETLLSASLTKLYFEEKIPLEKIIPLLTFNPSKIFNIEKRGSLKNGNFADIALINLNEKVKIEKFYSKSQNSPFIGKTLIGKNVLTIVNGKVVYDNGKFFI